MCPRLLEKEKILNFFVMATKAVADKGAMQSSSAANATSGNIASYKGFIFAEKNLTAFLLADLGKPTWALNIHNMQQVERIIQ